MPAEGPPGGHQLDADGFPAPIRHSPKSLVRREFAQLITTRNDTVLAFHAGNRGFESRWGYLDGRPAPVSTRPSSGRGRDVSDCCWSGSAFDAFPVAPCSPRVHRPTGWWSIPGAQVRRLPERRDEFFEHAHQLEHSGELPHLVATTDPRAAVEAIARPACHPQKNLDCHKPSRCRCLKRDSHGHPPCALGSSLVIALNIAAAACTRGVHVRP